MKSALLKWLKKHGKDVGKAGEEVAEKTKKGAKKAKDYFSEDAIEKGMRGKESLADLSKAGATGRISKESKKKALIRKTGASLAGTGVIAAALGLDDDDKKKKKNKRSYMD